MFSTMVTVGYDIGMGVRVGFGWFLSGPGPRHLDPIGTCKLLVRGSSRFFSGPVGSDL